MASLSFAAGWRWVKEGFQLFRSQPAVLSFLVFAGFIVTMLLNAVPLLGPILSSLVLPAMLLAIFEACREIEAKRRVLPAVILVGFRPEVRTPLLMLGAVYTVLFLLNVLTMDLQGMQELQKKPPEQMTDADRSSTLVVLAQMGFYAFQLMALAFCAPLIAWKRMGLGKAIFYSVAGMFGAFKAFMGMMFSWFAIMMAASMAISLIIGRNQFATILLIWIMLHFLMVLYCALYAAYRDLFSQTGKHEVRAAPAENAGATGVSLDKRVADSASDSSAPGSGPDAEPSDQTPDGNAASDDRPNDKRPQDR